MALPDTYKTSVDVAITLADGTGTPITLVVPAVLDATTLSDLEALAGSVAAREDVVIQSRGELLQVRRGAVRFPNLSFEAYLPGMTNAAVGLVRDFVAFENAYSANVSTYSTAAGAPKMIKVTIAVEGTDHGDADETVTITDWRVTYSVASALDGNKISLSGPVYGTVTFA